MHGSCRILQLLLNISLAQQEFVPLGDFSLGSLQRSLVALGFVVGLLVSVDPLLKLLLKLAELSLEFFLLVGALLESLCELHNLVLKSVRDLLELGHRACFGAKSLQLFSCHAAAQARLQVNDEVDLALVDASRGTVESNSQVE